MQLPTFESLNLLAVAPVLVLLGWACALLLIDVFLIRNKRLTAWLAALGILVTLALVLLQTSNPPDTSSQIAFWGMLTIDGFALFLQIVFLLAAFVGVLIAFDYLSRTGIERGEYYTLLMFTTGGMMVMAMAADLIMVFLALELLSIPLYVLAGFARPRLDSEESAMKYFLLGAFASGFLLYGIAMVYGGAQSTALADVFSTIETGSLNPLLGIGMGLILVGLGFKIAAVPFHMWTPDVYQGAPTPVTGFMSVGAKAGGFAALLRVLILAFPAFSEQWGIPIEVIAGLTMALGNIVAVSQSHIKRMLAYSSIAHAGYVLVAVAAAQQAGNVANEAVAAALFYLLAYAFTNLGAFAVVIAVERDDGSGGLIDDFAGLGRARPWLAAVMTLFMFSLTGIPPTGGMVGKWFVFRAAVNADLIVLAVIGVITSVISAFYYIRVVLVMYMREGDGQVTMRPALVAALALTAFGTLVMGVYPTPLLDLAQRSLMVLFAG